MNAKLIKVVRLHEYLWLSVLEPIAVNVWWRSASKKVSLFPNVRIVICQKSSALLSF